VFGSYIRTISDSEKQPVTFGNWPQNSCDQQWIRQTSTAVKNGERERECEKRRLMVKKKEDFSSFHSQLNMFLA
jgi:hypothetical protein